jgi:hypothetical protein
MSYFNKAEYLTALFRMLPFGLGALIIGANGLLSKSSVDSLKKNTGTVVWYGDKVIYTEDFHKYEQVFVVQIKDSIDTLRFHTYATAYREALISKLPKKGEKVTIWAKENKRIEQVQYKNDLIIKYTGYTGVYVFFLLLGIIYTTITLLYLIKNPAFLSKKDN